jgi:hypothetical protein
MGINQMPVRGRVNGLALRSADRRVCARIAALAALALLAGCQPATPKLPPGVHPSVEVGPPLKSQAWKAIASPADQDRISRLGLAWQEALDEAKKSNPGEVRAEGKLLLPRGGLPRPAPTPGSYNCRLIALGKATAKGKAFESFKPFFCYVLADDDGVLTIVKQTGSQRPAGQLWDDDDAKRLVFLGSLTLGDEEQPLAYGDDPKRNMAGVFERIAPFRWRLVIPWPQNDAKLDVFELTPVDFDKQPQ